jgi:ATP-dependent DNA helicase DinG
MDYSVPQAVIKFKQGVGRLIRSHQDRGVVMIIDERVFTKQYGKVFLKSLPNCDIIKASRAKVLERIRDWMI